MAETHPHRHIRIVSGTGTTVGGFVQEVDQWIAECMEAVRVLHRPSTDHGEDFDPYCVGCWEAGGMDGAPSWPCPTVQALPTTEAGA
jgi:hypothetical protein